MQLKDLINLTCAATFAFTGCNNPNTVSRCSTWHLASLEFWIVNCSHLTVISQFFSERDSFKYLYHANFLMHVMGSSDKFCLQRCYGATSDGVVEIEGSVDTAKYTEIVRLS